MLRRTFNVEYVIVVGIFMLASMGISWQLPHTSGPTGVVMQGVAVNGKLFVFLALSFLQVRHC